MIELILFSRESDSYRYYMYVCGQALVLLTEVRGMLVSLLLRTGVSAGAAGCRTSCSRGAVWRCCSSAGGAAAAV